MTSEMDRIIEKGRADLLKHQALIDSAYRKVNLYREFDLVVNGQAYRALMR